MRFPPRYRMPHHPSPQPRRAAPEPDRQSGGQTGEEYIIPPEAIHHEPAVQASAPVDEKQYPPLQNTPDSALLIAMALASDGGPCGARTLLRDTYPMIDVGERLQRALHANEHGMLEALSPMLAPELRTLEQMKQISQLAALFKKQLPNIQAAASSTASSRGTGKAQNSNSQTNNMNPMAMLNMLSSLGGMGGMGGSAGGMGGMGNMGNIASMLGGLGGMGGMGGNSGGMGGNSGGTGNNAGGMGNQMQMMEMLAKMMGNRNM